MARLIQQQCRWQKTLIDRTTDDNGGEAAKAHLWLADIGWVGARRIGTEKRGSEKLAVDWVWLIDWLIDWLSVWLIDSPSCIHWFRPWAAGSGYNLGGKKPQGARMASLPPWNSALLIVRLLLNGNWLWTSDDVLTREVKDVCKYAVPLPPLSASEFPIIILIISKTQNARPTHFWVRSKLLPRPMQMWSCLTATSRSWWAHRRLLVFSCGAIYWCVPGPNTELNDQDQWPDTMAIDRLNAANVTSIDEHNKCVDAATRFLRQCIKNKISRLELDEMAVIIPKSIIDCFFAEPACSGIEWIHVIACLLVGTYSIILNDCKTGKSCKNGLTAGLSVLPDHQGHSRVVEILVIFLCQMRKSIPFIGWNAFPTEQSRYCTISCAIKCNSSLLKVTHFSTRFLFISNYKATFWQSQIFLSLFRLQPFPILLG